jgi:hypothetical protein
VLIAALPGNSLRFDAKNDAAVIFWQGGLDFNLSSFGNFSLWKLSWKLSEIFVYTVIA